MNHLDEMTRADGTDVQIAIRRRQSFKNGFQVIDNFFLAADHQAVAVFQSPHAAAGAGVDEMHAVRLELFRAPDGIFVIGITAVDENVAFGKIRQQLLDRLIHRISRGHHQPDGARQ